jgi:hypothetical protein
MNHSLAHPEDEMFKDELFTGSQAHPEDEMFKDESFTGAPLRTKC